MLTVAIGRISCQSAHFDNLPGITGSGFQNLATELVQAELFEAELTRGQIEEPAGVSAA